MTERCERIPTPIEVARSEAEERVDNMESPRMMLPVILKRVTGSDMQILRALAESRSGPMTRKELAEEIEYSKRTVYRRVRGLKMTDEVREGGLLVEAEGNAVWFKSVDVAVEVGEYFAMEDIWRSEEE